MTATATAPVKPVVKKAQKPAPKKETAMAPKTTTTVKVAKKPATKKPTSPKAAPKKAPAAKKPAAQKMFLLYKNITNDVTTRARSSEKFDPIRYEGVVTGTTITQARKSLETMFGDEAPAYGVSYSYEKALTQAALEKFDGATEKVVNKGKNTYTVTLRNIEGLTEPELNELAIYAWIVNAGKKSKTPIGNESMMLCDFEFAPVKPLKNNRANITFTTIA